MGTTAATVERGKSMREGIERKTAHASCTMAMAMRSCLRHAKTRTVVTRVSTAISQKASSYSQVSPSSTATIAARVGSDGVRLLLLRPVRLCTCASMESVETPPSSRPG